MRKQIEARCEQFASAVVKIAGRIRRNPAAEQIADQLSDAATSSAANYRAAARGRSHKEFTAKLGTANEEIDETVYWLDLAADTRLAAGPELDTLRAEARELRAIIAKSYATAKRKEEDKDAERRRRRDHRR